MRMTGNASRKLLSLARGNLLLSAWWQLAVKDSMSWHSWQRRSSGGL